jgi:3-deoxy-manno-octulosonate cytidylyltransferase (CMP-KDO synthetase)
MITPEMIVAAVNPMLNDTSIECLNLICRIENSEEYLNRNTIKVVMNTLCDALYFSRSPIPSLDFGAGERMPVFKQVCVIPFRHNFLCRFADLAPTPLEQAESIDMIRAIEHGVRVRLVETFVETHAVDTPDDLVLVEKLMKEDWLRFKYDEIKVKERR